jgi:hypothetical protein
MAVMVRALARGVIAHGGAGRLSAFRPPSSADRRSETRSPSALTGDQRVEPAPLRALTLETSQATGFNVFSRGCRIGGRPKRQRPSDFTEGCAWKR